MGKTSNHPLLYQQIKKEKDARGKIYKRVNDLKNPLRKKEFGISNSRFFLSFEPSCRTSPKRIQGILFCTNPSFISVISKRAIKSRNSLSTFAIGLVGLGTVLFRDPFPQSQSHKISENNAEEYFHKTSSFLLQEKKGDHGVVTKVIWVKIHLA